MKPPDPSLILKLVATHFGIKGTVRTLMGEEDYNYFLTSDSQEKYLVKLSRPGVLVETVRFQSAILKYLHSNNFPLKTPEIIPALNGEEYVVVDSDQILRIQKWVAGRMLGDVNPRSVKLLNSWGNVCGYFSKIFQGFDHPAAHRFYKWNPSETLHSKKYLEYFTSKDQKEIANYFWNLFELEALPKLPKLRKSINHNDAHELNLICEENLIEAKITGVIDFGDAIYTETINELAIACAYASMFQADPIAAMQSVIKGYYEIFPIEEIELEILFHLITARLMITVATAAWNKHKEPNNKYLLVSEKVAWDLLNKLRKISPNLAHYHFRSACNLEPCPNNITFENWINSKGLDLAPIVKFEEEKIMLMDLSVGSLDLGAQENFVNVKKFESRIAELLDNEKANFGIGGYLEPRPFYTTEDYQSEGNNGAQWKTIHLGVDVWGKGGTPVFAPLDAVVESVQNNNHDRDYGPTLILRHEVNVDLTFFTLYGHLSLEVLKEFKAGDEIKKGQQIASIGEPPSNGNWPPHLHFQILLDTLNIKGDFPGAIFPHEVNVWKSICPDPMGSLNNPFFPIIKNHNQSKKEILARRKNTLGSSLSISYESPLIIVRGYMQWLYDDQGRRYLDTVNNVPHVGHQHPRVIAAAKKQLSVLNTNTRYLHENIVNYAEDLLATFPNELCVVHFVNSGSEANELALRMVKAYTGQKDMIAVEIGYHGNTQRTIDISSYKFDGKGGGGKPKHTHIVPLPDIYRGNYNEEKTAGLQYASYVDKAIAEIEQEGRKLGGFIAESVLSCGGQIVLPNGYLAEVYRQIRASGGICIADEVQVGFGRTGEKFWGFELQGVVPDIVTLGKPIANGHPMGAVVCTQAVADAFSNGMEYFNTFGGNPVSCAIGHEVLKVIQEEGLQKKAFETGEYLLNALRSLQLEFPIIGDVRGKGLFLGIELVLNQNTKEPAAKEAKYLINRMRERGILMSTDGPYYNVLKIKPPMCFDKNNADYLLSNLRLVLKEDFLKKI